MRRRQRIDCIGRMVMRQNDLEIASRSFVTTVLTVANSVSDACVKYLVGDRR